MICEVCGKLVETTGEQNYEGTAAVHEPVSGESVRCEGRGVIVHVECMAPDAEFCRACVGTFEAIC